MHIDQFKQLSKGEKTTLKRIITLPHGGSGNTPAIILTPGTEVEIVSHYFSESQYYNEPFRYVKHPSADTHFAVNADDLV